MPHRRNSGFSLVELLALAAVLLVMVAVFIKPAGKDRTKTRRIKCVNNLKNLALAARVEENDQPSSASATNSVSYFRSLWPYFGSPGLLVCPEDKSTTAATSMTNLSATNVSYFASLAALTGPPPRGFLFGDDNLHLGDGKPISGSLIVRSNTPLAWTQDRHSISKGPLGMVAMNDGSVQQFLNHPLREALAAQGSFTKKLLFR